MGYFVSGGEVTARRGDRQEDKVGNVVRSSCVTWLALQPPFKNGTHPLEPRRCGCGDYCNNLTSYRGGRALFTIKPLIFRLLEIPETWALPSPA